MNTTLHVTIDKQTKNEANKLAKELGLDLSTVVKASLKNFVATKIFHVEKSCRMTPYLEGIIEQVNKEDAWYGPFKTGDEASVFLDRYASKKKRNGNKA